MKIFGYYWKGFGHTWSDILYHTLGLWTYGRVMDEITSAVHPDFGWAMIEAHKDTERFILEAFERGVAEGQRRATSSGE